jgi:hypothetical protein
MAWVVSDRFAGGSAVIEVEGAKPPVVSVKDGVPYVDGLEPPDHNPEG